MGEVEERLKTKLNPEEYELALRLTTLSASRVRAFIEEEAERVASD